MKRGNELTIQAVIVVLKLKDLQRHPVKIVEGSMEDLIFPIRYFRRIIQLIIIKFDILKYKDA